MDEFRVGDIVRLKGGTVEFVILNISGSGFRCGMLPLARGMPSVHLSPDHVEPARRRKEVPERVIGKDLGPYYLTLHLRRIAPKHPTEKAVPLSRSGTA